MEDNREILNREHPYAKIFQLPDQVLIPLG